MPVRATRILAAGLLTCSFVTGAEAQLSSVETDELRLLYIDPSAVDMHEHLNTVDTPLNQLSAKELCPGSKALERINASLR